MKVQPDQIRALQDAEAQKARRTGKEPGESFEDLLAREAGKSDGAAQVQVPVAGPVAPPLLPQQIAEAQQVEAVSKVEDRKQAGQQVMESLDRILGEWENYAAQLDAPGQALRTADGSLQRIEDDVKQLKDDWPGLGEDHPGLQSVVNELEILAVTERYKFNRGDYLG